MPDFVQCLCMRTSCNVLIVARTFLIFTFPWLQSMSRSRYSYVRLPGQWRTQMVGKQPRYSSSSLYFTNWFYKISLLYKFWRLPDKSFRDGNIKRCLANCYHRVTLVRHNKSSCFFFQLDWVAISVWSKELYCHFRKIENIAFSISELRENIYPG